MNAVELLAPAGDFPTALAALEAGADAVYCGLGDFSARAFAVNFSLDDLKNLLRVAHARGRKVYVTFNTVIDESSLETAVSRLADLWEARPDALIVQDIGVARIVRRHFPELALHASTQLVAHNLEGVLALRDLGFSRVVLARELSLEEIVSIAKRCGGMELECFIHGALCYSISGLCLFSAMEKGRSGNRGACAYCCRSAYEVDADMSPRQVGVKGSSSRADGWSSADADCSPRLRKTLPFSMKDLRLGEDVLKLVDAGVASLKIEGRMKSALYVASVTKYYRQILDARAREAMSTTGANRTARDSRAGSEGGCAREVTSTTGANRTARDSRAGSEMVTVADLETVFSRRTTELYLNGSPANKSNNQTIQQSNNSSSPIDPTSLGHLGTPIGTVKRVTKDREGRSWVRFHTARALERHDGLQFSESSREGRAPARQDPAKPFGFGIAEMRTALSRSTVFEVAAGTDVEVLLPADADCSPRLRDSEPIHPGMTVYCSMSNAVKRMFPIPSFRPSDYAGGTVLDVAVTLEPTKISAEARLGTPAREVTSSTERPRTVAGLGDRCVRASLQGTFAPAKDPSRTYAAVEKALAKLGGTDYRLGKLIVNDPDRLFAPASFLNDLRRDLVEQADEARAKAKAERVEKALVDADMSPRRVGVKSSSSRADGWSSADADCSPRLRTLRIRPGQAIPAGEWDEVVVAINSKTEVSDLSRFESQISDCELQSGAGNQTIEQSDNRLSERDRSADNPTIQQSNNPTIRLALPVYTKETDFNHLRTCVKRFLRAGYEKWEASDLATLRMLREMGVTDLTADWTLYAFNSQALAALTELGVSRFVASPENNPENRAYLAESGYSVALLVQQSTPLFISLTKPAVCACGDLKVYSRDGLWITTKRLPRTFSAPKGAATRVDLGWDPPQEDQLP